MTPALNRLRAERDADRQRGALLDARLTLLGIRVRPRRRSQTPEQAAAGRVLRRGPDTWPNRAPLRIR